MSIIVRPATVDDMPAVNALYNALVEQTTVAWTEDREPLEDRVAWFAQQEHHGHPVLVAVNSDAVNSDAVNPASANAAGVIGYGSYGGFRGEGRWPGYRFTVEHSIHVDEHHWGLGIGRALMEQLIEVARNSGLHVMVGAVDADNLASIAFHERLGFTEVARMPEVGRKFGRWLDLVLLQLRLE